LPLDEPQQLIWSDGLGTGEGFGVVSCMEQTCFLRAKGRDGTKGTCELVLPLGEPQPLIRSDGLGPGEGGGVVSCMEQRCFLEAAGRGGTRDSLK